MQVGNSQNTASNIIAHLARKHSPVVNAAPSATPTRLTYPNVPSGNQAPQMGMSASPGAPPTQQYLQRPPGNVQAMPTGRPPPSGLQPNLGSPPNRYSGGLVQTAQPNQVPQTVLQRPPPSHNMPVGTNPLTSPKSPRSRSKSPKPSGAISNPATPPPPNSNPALSPALQRNNISSRSPCNSPATVIIGGLGVSTEKCEPPSKIPLPEGEVRIEKVPNLHAQLLQQAHIKAQQQSIHPALPLPLLQVQQGVEVPVAAPSPDNDTLPNPVGLQQQMQQAMQAATAVSAQPMAVPNNIQQPQVAQPIAQPVAQPVEIPNNTQPVSVQPVASPNNMQPVLMPNKTQQPVVTTAPALSQSNHSTAPHPSHPAGTKQYVPIQPKPNVSVPSSSAASSTPQLQPQNQSATSTPQLQPQIQSQAVQVGIPKQKQMQVVLINRPAQPGAVQQQQQPQQANVPQQPGQLSQFVQQAGTSLPNQFPRLAGHIPHNASPANTDSPLIKRLLQTGTNVQTPRVSPPQQQVVQPNPAASIPNSTQYAGPNQTAQQVLPSQGSNHAVPVQTTQPQQQPMQPHQTVVGCVNNTGMLPQQATVVHRPSPPLPLVSEQLQQHRENQRQLQQQQQQQQMVALNVQTNSPKPNGNVTHESNHTNASSQKTNGPTSAPVLNNQESTNGPTKPDRTVTEGTEVPKCNGTSQAYENVPKSTEEKMEVDPIVKPVSKSLHDSLLKQRLVNGYASDSELPIKNDVVTVNRVEVPDKNESSGILEAALSIAGIEPDSDSRTSSGKSTPVDPILTGGKGYEPVNHVLNGDILCDRSKTISPIIGDVNSNQGTKTGIVIIGNNGTMQDANIPNSTVMATTTNTGKQVNQLILCRDIRENLPANLHILPSNYNNNNPQQQQAGTIVTAGVPQQTATCNTSGSAQVVASTGNNTVQVRQGAIITVQQPAASGGQTQIPMQMSTQQGQPLTFQLQQQQPSNVQTVNVQQSSGGVRQLVVQQPIGVQQQTLIVRPVGQQQQQQQTMNIQVQNPNGQTGQQVIRLPVSIQGGQQQILSVQRPLQAGGQQQTQQFVIVNTNQQNTTSRPAPNSITTVKTTGSLKRPAPVDSPKSKDSKVNNTVEGSSSSSSSSKSHKEKKKKHHSSSKKRRKSSSSSSSSSSHHQCSKKDKDKDKDSEQPKTPAMVCMCEWKGCRR